jgi:ABC-type phosphate transport system auxiliary subunit
MTLEKLEKANQITKEIELINSFFSNLKEGDLITLRREDHKQLNGGGMANFDKDFKVNKSTHDALIECLKNHLDSLKKQFQEL